jgi:hypothetical protein
MTTERKIKKVQEHQFNVEVAELNKVVKLVVESEDLLLGLEVKSLGELELKLNERSGFTNPMASANAYGLEPQYKRLLELEKLINNRLSSDDLTSSKTLKSTVIDKIREKYTTYFTEKELQDKKVLDSIIKQFNSLDRTVRQQVGVMRNGEMNFTPFSYFKR